MENKALGTFFKNNYETIQELTNSFNEYKKNLHQKVFQLKDAIPQSEYAPSAVKQWIYDGCCLVHDYTINPNYWISVDTYITVKGWEIQLFGREQSVGSSDFLYNVMCKDADFLPQPLESYERAERLIYQRFDEDVEISEVAKVLSDLLLRIEKYKNR